MNRILVFLSDWRALIVPALVLLVTLAVGLAVKKLVFKWLRSWAARTRSHADDVVVAALNRPASLWVLILAVHTSTQVLPISQRPADIIAKLLLALWILSLTSAAAGLASRLVRTYGGQVQTALPVTSLTQNVARLVVITVGVLILLNLLGVAITPILTALGIGGLAVALALQDTLANFFAGFYLSIAGQIRVGDYIKVEGGGEGYVADITWRSTTIRTLTNNLIIVPNSKLGQAIVTNFHFPEKRMALSIQVPASYDADPDLVERVLLEEASRAFGEVPGLLAEPAPSVRLIPGFGDSSLVYSLNFQVAEFVDQYLAQHELRKRVLKRFRAEGIEIPFPMRVVRLEKAAGEGPETGR